MSDYTLQCFLESGNSYKPALMLELCAADWQAEWVDFFNGKHKSSEFRDQNNFGEVPVLIDHTEDDLTISQSGVMLYHLADKFGKFGPLNKAEEREIMRWILWDNHKLTGYVAIWRFLKKFLKKDGDPETEFMKGRAIAAIKTLNHHLADHKWVACGRPTIADISLAGYLFWPDHIGIDWNDFPHINDWLTRIRELDGWKSPEDLLPSSA
ncbi:MAG: glutathione S-transferase family protein [Rhizobiaceae bacterium]|nr:glutathione S-transferase family protein [Rhizobiaceae bacterium]